MALALITAALRFQPSASYLMKEERMNRWQEFKQFVRETDFVGPGMIAFGLWLFWYANR